MKNLFTLKGRVNRSKYFWGSFLSGLIYTIPEAIAMNTQSTSMWIATALLAIPCLIIITCLVVQRLHDLDRPGTHYWLFLIPFYNIYLACLLVFKKGTEGSNKYGEDPLGIVEPA